MQYVYYLHRYPIAIQTKIRFICSTALDIHFAQFAKLH